ncbi:phosphoribosylglycinamide formyltransferase [Gracilibacillus alcaliphilus]|uniref:phosphoribosylglycinamide formyltransferase n=1 Tax=Gracilibacillus alcaliphilus TaxID=1401441 RepID=UPI00195C5005|nr:phosphoribosylglycinamide formyltransferase [Gracilibacillus alcaliphilus]MBM7676079.1 phosphoribosylglycinamide formyltransferase-1 [Gracilibacillus alcaliphilus]
MTKLAVFASGTGSNYDAIIHAIQQGELEAEVALLVCDQPEAKVIEKAKANGTETFVFEPKQYPNKQAFETEIVEQLKQREAEWIILAGYMRLVGATLLNAFEGRMINIHPSLLPSFPGLDAIGQAFEAGVKVSGVTIHYVDAGMDTGKIIAQDVVKIHKDMSKADLQAAIQRVEHQLYPATIQKLITGGE